MCKAACTTKMLRITPAWLVPAYLHKDTQETGNICCLWGWKQMESNNFHGVFISEYFDLISSISCTYNAIADVHILKTSLTLQMSTVSQFSEQK